MKKYFLLVMLALLVSAALPVYAQNPPTKIGAEKAAKKKRDEKKSSKKDKKKKVADNKKATKKDKKKVAANKKASQKKDSQKSVAKKAPKVNDPKSEHHFKELAYSVYIKKMVEKHNKGERLTRKEKLHLADSYLFTGDYLNAKQWYEQSVFESSDALYKLRYARTLQSIGDCENAKIWYQKYEATADVMVDAMGNPISPSISDKLICVDALSSAENGRYIQLTNMKKINSDKYEFSPAYYRGGLVFVSNNLKFQPTKRTDVWLDDDFMNLYYAEMEDDSITNTKPFSDELNSKYHEGPLTFSKNGKTVFFTRNNFLNGKRKKGKDGLTSLTIFTAQLKNGTWQNITELPFNPKGDFVVCHPTLSANGQLLFFAANFKNGYGGLDLYVSKLIDGKWGIPQNLGKQINTVGNDAFPYIHEDGALYFASNRPESVGGLDIYFATPISMGEDIRYGNVQNLGKPFNSIKDDFGFITNLQKTSGYFTSSRTGGQGEDDIYKFSFNKPSLVEEDIPMALASNTDDRMRFGTSKGASHDERGEICVFEEDGNENIPFAQISVFELSKDQNPQLLNVPPTVYHSDENGIFKAKFKPFKQYIFKVKRKGFEDTDYRYFTEELYGEKEAHDFCIPVKKVTCQHIIGYTMNAETRTNIGNAKITFQNLCSDEENTIISDSDGKFELCLPCNCQFKVEAKKPSYTTELQNYVAKDDKCDDTNVLNLWLYPASTSFNGENFNLETGSVLALKRIFYDFDKHYIRTDATADLDELVILMKKFPSMEIELSSHTDSRGTAAYNRELSQKRADAATRYLIQHGILAYRIQAIGYGESHLLNYCKDGMNCSETEHQMNRRTEVKITKFDQSEVKVKYINNLPKQVDGKQ